MKKPHIEDINYKLYEMQVRDRLKRLHSRKNKIDWGKILVYVIASLVGLAFWILFIEIIAGAFHAAQAEEINILGCRGSSPNGLNRREIVSVYNRASDKLHDELGIRLKRTSLTVRSCRWSSDYRLLYDGVQFGRLLPYFPKKLVKPSRINLAIVPGISSGERIGMGGVASDICNLSEWNLAIAAIPRFNSSGFDGLDYGPLAVAHEVVHVLGGDHINIPCNSMHPAPLNEQQRCGLTRFLPESKAEIRDCRFLKRKYATSKFTK